MSENIKEKQAENVTDSLVDFSRKVEQLVGKVGKKEFIDYVTKKLPLFHTEFIRDGGKVDVEDEKSPFYQGDID